MSQSHASKKKRYEAKDAELLNQVSARLVTKETLKEKLAQHVEQVKIFYFYFFRKNIFQLSLIYA